ncbi:hypothetical protein [Afipia felis]
MEKSVADFDLDKERLSEIVVKRKALAGRLARHSSWFQSNFKIREIATVSLKATSDSLSPNARAQVFNRTTWHLVMLAGVIVQVTSALAQVSGSNASLAAKVADGHPWKMTMEDGRIGSLVLFENGVGKMTGGPMDLEPKWRPTPDGMCLKPGALLPERCVQLARTNNGYVGLRAGKQIFKLER